MISAVLMEQEVTMAVLFGGIGGFSAGAKRSKIEYGGKVWKTKLLCSIDYDPVACLNHDKITGGKEAVVMDLFTRQQYIDWHGHEPPAEWREVEPWDLWVAFGYQVPFYLFTSPPCKGLSALLPKKSAESKKYQALNLLTIRGIELTLRACQEYGGKIPAFIHLENVPRILTRGKDLLLRIRKLLEKFGCRVDMRADHNLGEVGGLGQNRLRFQILARDEVQVPNFVYLPTKKPLRTIGDVIGPLPMPGDTENGGPLHRLPKLEWKTWVRLGLIRAGGDWRDLQGIPFEQYRIVHEPRSGAFGVQDWNKTSGAVTGTAGPGRSNDVTAVSDMRFCFDRNTHAAIYRVCRSEDPGPTVTGAHGPNNGAISVSDPKLVDRAGRHPGVYRIVKMDEPGPCVTGTRFGSGAIAVADPYFDKDIPKFNHYYKITEYEETAGTVTSGGGPSNGGIVVSDPRNPNDFYNGSYNRQDGSGVQDWDSTAKTVRGRSQIHNSAASINDPRISDRPGRYTDKFRMQSMEGQAGTVTGVTDVQSGAQLVADMRYGSSPRSGTMGVIDWEHTAPTVIGSSDVHAGASAVADPREFPKDNERGTWILIAEDGTWHRPLTTYELAMLQSFPRFLPDGRPFQLEGCNDAKAREYIGNAYPPDAAEEAVKVILLAAAKAAEGITFEFSHDDIWVMPEDNASAVTILQ